MRMGVGHDALPGRLRVLPSGCARGSIGNPLYLRGRPTQEEGMTAPTPLSSPPLISVIVPVHDVAGHVEAAIASLHAQTLTDFEAIVVDDGSSDGSGVLAAAAAGSDARFRVIRQPNRGLSGARNAGLDVATGAFIAFLDGDDRFAPDYLERLHGVLEATGADWAACAIRNVHPDGASDVHSAIHGAPEPGEARRYPLTDWRAVIRHFPSAWNKLYRRTLIDGLRFDEGTWFEDHAFYYRAAARTDHIEHLPEPLYLQTRGRPGQITAADSERVFEQISVLETLEGIMSASDKSGDAEAFARIATRLVFERSTALRDADRRARFAAAARAFFAARDLPWRPDWDRSIGRAWGLAMAGLPPVTVVIPSDGAIAPLAATLESLAAQTLRDIEVVVVTDAGADPPDAPDARMLSQPGHGAGSARDYGLAQARGEYVVFLDAGDTLMPRALEYRVETLLRSGAVCGVTPMHLGTAIHDGWHEPPARVSGGMIPAVPDFAIRVHAHPSAWIFQRRLLVRRGIGFGDGVLGTWGVAVAAVLAASWVQWFPEADCVIGEDPAARRLWRAPARARDLAAAIDRIAALPDAGRLPACWQRRLFARAVWEKARFADYPAADGAVRFLGRAMLLALWRGWVGKTGPLDPYLDPLLRRLFGAPPG